MKIKGSSALKEILPHTENLSNAVCIWTWIVLTLNNYSVQVDLMARQMFWRVNYSTFLFVVPTLMLTLPRSREYRNWKLECYVIRSLVSDCSFHLLPVNFMVILSYQHLQEYKRIYLSGRSFIVIHYLASLTYPPKNLAKEN